MPYLVDGNNVMAQIVGWHRDRAAARRRLIHDLARFVAIRKAKLRVVFDGSPDDEFPEGRKYKSVQILYAKKGSDADSRIKGLVDKSTNKRDIIVVSSDKALCSYVAGRGAKVVTSGKFRRMLEEALSQQREKPGEQEPLDVDEWLNFFSDRDQ